MAKPLAGEPMGVGFLLVNATKREQIMFQHIGASKARELAGNPAASAITTWYLLENRGDNIAFVSDTDDDWPFPDLSKQDSLDAFPDVTDQIVKALIANGILDDRGKDYVDADDPDRIFTRDLRNAWMPQDPS